MTKEQAELFIVLLAEYLPHFEMQDKWTDENIHNLQDALGRMMIDVFSFKPWENKNDTSKPCEHDWCFSNEVKMNNPPQQDAICRKCLSQKRFMLGSFRDDEYPRLLKKKNEGE